MKKIKTVLVVFILSICSSVISLFPLKDSRGNAGLFSFEPDVPYVANAISYIYTNNIIYSAHPATPTITLLSYSMFPLRIYAKTIDKTPFFVWTIRNQNLLYLYERYFISLIFFVGMSVFLNLIYKISNNLLVVMSSWLAMFSYTNTPYLGIVIQSEPLSFLILSLWFLAFYYFIKRKNIRQYLLLCFISGIAFANKLPNMFFVFASVSLFLLLNTRNFKKNIKNLLLGVSTSGISFFIFTWPIRTQYGALWSWVSHLSTHSGVHGRGGFEILNLNTQFTNLKTLFSIETSAGLMLIVVITLFIIYRKRINKSIVGPVGILLLWMIIGIFVFSKFPLSHYHQFHFMGIIVVGSYLITKLNNKFVYILIPVLLLATMYSNIKNYWKVNMIEVKKYIVLEQFVKNNPHNKGTVWEWGRSVDYSLLHTRDWICNPYEEYLSSERPNLYSLTTNMNEVIVSCATKTPLFKACWDKLYIQESEITKFIDKYKDKRFTKMKIEGSKDMWLITSNHCN